MPLNTSRLDRFISETCQINRKSVRLLLAQKRVFVDGELAKDTALIVDKFSSIKLDGDILQSNQAYYIMLNKPAGVVCATKDKKHKTVIDLLVGKYSQSVLDELHIVGRLDLNTSGLVLLTNDSRWSERLTSPEHKVEKCYNALLAKPLTQEYIKAFSQGMYFSYEDITTRPAKLSIIAPTKAQIILIEGRYHQIKRMFGRFRNQVLSLHRQSIGKLTLDEGIREGESRDLMTHEVNSIFEK